MKRLLVWIAGAATLLGLLVGAVWLTVDIVYYPGAPAVDFPPPRDPAEARSQDIAYFRLFLDLDRSYTAETRRQATALLDELEERLEHETLTDGQFQLAIARAVAIADNGHTNIWMGAFWANITASSTIPLVNVVAWALAGAIRCMWSSWILIRIR